MSQAPRFFDWISLFALTGLWGTSFLFNEIALRSFPPSIIVAGRLTVAALTLAMVVQFSNLSVIKIQSNWLTVLIMSLLGTITPFYLTVWAQQHIDSAVTGILMSVMPLFVVGLAHVFIPGERLNIYRVVGFVCGFFGVFCVIGPESIGAYNNFLAVISICAILGAAFSYAVNSIYTRHVSPGNPIVASAGVMLVGGMIAVPTAAYDIPTFNFAPSTAAVMAVLVLGLLCTGLASVLYYRIVQGPGPVFLSLVNYLIPVWAVIIGALVLNETLSELVYIGFALILIGIAISEFGQSLQNALLRRRETRSALNTNSFATEESCN